MPSSRDELRWSPRVPKWKIRRLYESDAQGVLDQELLEEVGWTLLLRCQNILTVAEAKRGRVSCPRCARRGSPTVIERGPTTTGDKRDRVITCPECSWQITWGAYALSYSRKQLNAGGARSAFAAYVRTYLAARNAREKMLAVDRLIHEFHYSTRVRPDQPTRPVGVNLIQGKLASVLQFLDELSGLPPTRAEQAGVREEWEQNVERYRSIDWRAIVAEQRAQRQGAQASGEKGGKDPQGDGER